MPVSLIPGSTPVFQVTPVFSGATFTPVAANVFLSTSDPVNFPVELVPTDPTGLTFQSTIPVSLRTPETVTVTWQYHNADGTNAIVQTVLQLELPPTPDDITGGTVVQIA